ncbi:MAG: FG-GAP repeat protein [Alphaproteobacteria bacterium]|nr:FG-GAP repeat protein [Alphaproteobacteria bacterium]MCB9700132.1 FG-GAP repeat protein [Alphaproteobacteria bacterium]
MSPRIARTLAALCLIGCAPVTSSDGAARPDLQARLVTVPDWSTSGAWISKPAGDVNGDGYDDVLLGDPTSDVPASNAGSAVLHLGSATGLSSAPAWSITGSVADERVGKVSAAGDVDADGYDDVLVSAYGASLYGESNEGIVWLYRGGPAGLSAAPAWTLEGNAVSAYVGRHLAAAGDVDGDGYDDVLISGANDSLGLYRGGPGGLAALPDWTITGSSMDWLGRVTGGPGDVDGDGYDDVVLGLHGGPGAVRVYLGSPTGLSVVPAMTWEGDPQRATFGFGGALALGDLDGDGFDDLAIGSEAYDLGVVEIHRGSPSGLSVDPIWTLTPVADWDFGQSVACAGDVDGDGDDDLVVGSNTFGAVYLGSASGPMAVAALTRETYRPAVSTAGDVNGDGYDDVLIPYGTYPNGTLAIELYDGRPLADTDADGFPDLLDLCPGRPDPTQGDLDGDGVGDACDTPELAIGGTVVHSGTVDLVASGVGVGEQVEFWAAEGTGGAGPCPLHLGGLCLDLGAPAARLGTAIAGADGVATLTANVPALVLADGQYVVQAAIRRGGAGSVASPVVAVDPYLDWDGDGLLDATEGLLGTDPTSTDTDGDGLSDLFELANPHHDPTSADTDGDGVDDGVDVCLAGDDLLDVDADGVPDACDLCPSDADPGQADADGDGLGDVCEGSPLSAPTVLSAPGVDVAFGYSLAGAGDVNGDGYDDVVVGAPFAETQPGGDDGAAVVYLGGPTGLSVVPAWGAFGASDARLGWSVDGVGDVNGDGYDDVAAIGSGGANSRALVHLGGPGGPVSPAAWSYDGGFGCTRVDGGGDVDGDGYDEVLVGCWIAPSGSLELFSGGPNGPSTVADWTATSLQSDDPPVIATGDVNGDGYGDLVVGERVWSSIDGDGLGRVSLFLGAASGLSHVPLWSAVGSTDEELGKAVAIGDVDGDGYDDVVASTGRGAVQLWSGTPLGPWGDPITLTDGYGDSAFGAALATADVNGDGFEDVLVGAPNTTHPEIQEGAALLFLGSPEGPRATAAWQHESDVAAQPIGWPHYGYASVDYGGRVASAGDIDGDGLEDVLIDARGYDYTLAGQAGVGLIYVHLGQVP